MSKMTYLWLSGVFFQALITPKLVFGAGFRWESLRRSPRPSSRLGMGTPSTPPFPLDAFSVAISAPLAPRLSGPRHKFLAKAYGLPIFFLTYSWPTLKPGAAPDTLASGIKFYSSFQISRIIILDIQNNYSGYPE